MPLTGVFPKEERKTIAAEPAGEAFYDLLLSGVRMSSSLERDQARELPLQQGGTRPVPEAPMSVFHFSACRDVKLLMEYG